VVQGTQKRMERWSEVKFSPGPRGGKLKGKKKCGKKEKKWACVGGGGGEGNWMGKCVRFLRESRLPGSAYPEDGQKKEETWEGGGGGFWEKRKLCAWEGKSGLWSSGVALDSA